ncbi:MAG: FKBP-type peptidyl-prolyl cis-trans isomerase [Bacteroidia bacterium]|jgi:FKBP-type peptidyl-prolyl cis-trans isomerase|nr:FKBP-type peptidyl-prolyl cis-trans isomerase [Bacteroidia bacterium]
MKNSILVLAAISIIAISCGTKKTENGVEYTILKHTDGTLSVDNDSTLFLYGNYQLSIASNDSIIVETYTKNTPVFIPVNEPNFRSIFETLSVGDSIKMTINADTFFLKSFGSGRPPFVKEGENIHFTFSVAEIINEKQLEKKQQDEINEMRVKDSVAFEKAVSMIPNIKRTASGLAYVVEKDSKGKAVKKGNKVTALYRGTFLNGQVFDENVESGITISAGLGQVISGWDELLLLMKQGQKVKAFIPWNIAYGPRGDGRVIPPFSSLVFELELTKVD